MDEPVESAAVSFRSERQRALAERLARYRERAGLPSALEVRGRLTRMVGMTFEAAGCRAAVGEQCRVSRELEQGDVEAEVVGFSADRLLLMPINGFHGVAPNAPVVPTGKTARIGVGPAFLGRVVDGLGRPLDGGSPPALAAQVSRERRSINPLQRAPIRKPLDVGVRAINALLTVGQGQRLGLFAPSGAGKSVLLGMMTRCSRADVTVVGLIGERGREVQEFVSSLAGSLGLSRAVVVACPSDDPPLMRVRGAMLATTIAEYFRDQGCQVLLLLDSLTRYAQAHREISLAVGEPPATRGYPPSVFARLPQLVERAGNGSGPRAGGITAFYTVLTEADLHNDPLSDAARAILDGHIVLSRALAEAGHFPAIDVEASVSRAMDAIVEPEHRQLALRFRRLNATFNRSADLINVGAYTRGQDVELDLAVQLRPPMMAFLAQGREDCVSLEDSRGELGALIGNATALVDGDGASGAAS